MNQEKEIFIQSKNKIPFDGIVIFSLSIIALAIFIYFDSISVLLRHAFSTQSSLFVHIITGFILFSVGFGIFGIRRWSELRASIPLHERNERALRISEERFKSLVNSLDDVVFTLDRKQRHTAFFGRWVQGYDKLDPESFIGKTPRDLFDPADALIHENANKRALEGESVTYEWKLNTNGDVHYFEVTVSPLRDELSTITGIVGVGHDITEKKQFEKEINRHEQELRTLLENTPDIVARYDRDERYIYVNRAFESTMSVNRNTIVGKKQGELPILKELTPFWQDSISTVFHSGEGATIESEFPTPSGIKYFQARLVPELNPEKKVEYVMVVARDLTKHKKTEDNLRRSEEQLERILQTTPGGLTIIDLNGRIYFANPTAEAILNLHKKNAKEQYYNDPAITITTVDGKPFPEKDLPYIQVMMTGEPVFGVEHAIEHPDGQRVVVSVNAAPLNDYHGKLTGIITSITDITKVKQTEEAARKNEQRFRDLANSISDVFFAVDQNMHCTYWNRASEELTGIVARNAIARNIKELIPAGLFSELNDLLSQSLVTQETKTLVKKAKFNGKVYYFDINIYPAKHGLSVFFKDVSERMYAERERERLIAELQDALIKVKTLSGLLPICAFCKKIRDDGGYWHQVEAYIKEHSEANFSHGVCPECAKKHYPEYYKEKQHQHENK
jgi:PAS domain S-box-containing protein